MPRRSRRGFGDFFITYSSAHADEATRALKSRAANYRRGCDAGYGSYPGYYLVNYQIPAELEDALLPHWREFIGAIQSSDLDNQSWALHAVKLPQKMLDALQATMITRDIHTLKIRNVCKSHDEAHYEKIGSLACEVLGKNTSIKRLVLDGPISFGSEFCQALRESASLEELHLTYISFRDNVGLLARTLYAARSLKHISLRHSVIDEGGGELLASFVGANWLVSSLDLGDVNISDVVAEKIAESLFDCNTNLRVLTLVGERSAISELGRKALCNALFCSNDMEYIAASNHTCFVQTVCDSVEPSPKEFLLGVLNRDTCPKDNRRWKILSYLYATNGKGSELRYTSGIPSGVNEFRCYQRRNLIPEILAFVSHDLAEDPPEESSEAPSESPCDADNEQSVGGMRALAGNLLARSWQKLNPSTVESNSYGSDAASVESDASFDGYDSELEDLDEAFEEDETDEVYDEFHNSFSDASFSGNRLRLTVLYQVLQLWGLPLMDKSPPLPETGSKRPQQSPESKPKKMRREIESLAD